MRLIILCIGLCLTQVASAQVGKGEWWTDGNVNMTSFQPDLGESYTTILLEMRLGHFVANKVLVGGYLGLRLDENFIRVGHEVFGRYYFKALENQYFLFSGLAWRREENRLSRVGGGYSLTTIQEWHLRSGINQVLSKNVTLEYLLDYNFLRIRRNETQRLQDNGKLNFSLRLRYAFHSKLPEPEVDDPLQKGRWMLGGSFTIGDEGLGDLSFSQFLSPEAGYFFWRHLMIGGVFNFLSDERYQFTAVELIPTARYYLSLGRRDKLFATVGSGVNYLLFYNPPVQREQWVWRALLQFGWSKFITRRVALSTYLDWREDALRIGNNVRFPSSIKRTIGLRVGLQCFLK